MLDGRLPGMHAHKHPHVEIDGQAEYGLDVPSVPRRRGRDHGEDQSQGLRVSGKRGHLG